MTSNKISEKQLIPKRGVAQRYGLKALKTIERWVDADIFPPPDVTINNRHYWWTTTLEEHERRKVVEQPAKAGAQ